MFVFGKKERKTIDLKLKAGQLEGDAEAGTLNLEAYGIVDGEQIFCHALYSAKTECYDDLSFDKMVYFLENAKDLVIPVELIYLNKKPIRFKIDLSALSERFDFDDFTKLELLAWGINKKSIFE